MSGPRLDRPDQGEGGTKASPAELISDLRSGRTDAAYELLGRQAPIKAWQEALAVLAEAPTSADLELAAHRALRRPPQVVASLLRLAEAAGTPQAAFVARAVAVLRSEKELSARAIALRDQLVGQNDVEVALAADDAFGSLYLILSRDLVEAAQVVQRLRTEEPSLKLLSGALEHEYQRLLELGRTVRWTSGSYRYFLRHALADLALLAELEGRIGELSFRLLQQQVENPEENEDLIPLLSGGTRRRFFSWALERGNADQHPSRTRFVLRLIRQYLDPLDRASVVSAIQSKDPDVKVDALIVAVALDPERNDVDREIAENIDDLEESAARRLVEELIALEPRRLRLDRISATRRQLIVESGVERPTEVTRQIATLITGVTEIDQVESLVSLAEEISADGGADEAFAEIAAVLSTRAETDAQWSQAFDRLIAGARLGTATWSALPDLSPELRARVYPKLVAVTEASSVGTETRRLLDRVPIGDDALLGAIAAVVLDGTLDVEALAQTDEAFRTKLAERALEMVAPLEEELARARSLLAQGQTQVEADLRRGLRPIIERAIERADGNSRLQDDYRRLLSPDVASERPIAAPVFEVSETTLAELDRLGAQVVVSSSAVHIELTSGDGEQSRGRLRYLAVLDQRGGAGGKSAGGNAVLSAYIDALGRTGDAEQLVSDLFERGSLFKLAVGLSAGTRHELVKAAVAHGLTISEHWYSDSALGEWLSGLEIDGASPPSEQRRPSEALEVVKHARSLTAEVEVARSKTAQLWHEAKRAFVADSTRPFEDLELTIDGYVQLWHALSGLGISQVAALGSVVDREALDPERHEIIGDPSSPRFIVRSAGVIVDEQVLAKARVEGSGN